MTDAHTTGSSDLDLPENCRDMESRATPPEIPYNHSVLWEPECKGLLSAIVQQTAESDFFLFALHRARLFYLPCMAATGVAGSLLLATTLLTSQLRRVACVHYMAAMLLCDAIFLVSLGLIWLADIYPTLAGLPGWCQVIYLFSNASNFMSVWLMAMLTVNRYYCLVSGSILSQDDNRSARKTSCSTLKAKAMVIALVILALIVYVNLSLTIGSNNQSSVRCVPLSQFIPASLILHKLDVLFNILFPYVIVMVFCGATLKSLAAYYKSRREIIMAGSPTYCPQSLVDLRLTRTTLLLAGTFLALTLPSQSLRIWFTSKEMLYDGFGFSRSEFAWQQASQLLYHTRFGMDWLVLIFSHNGTRRAFRTMALKTRARLQRLTRQRSYDNLPLTAMAFTYEFSTTLLKLNETSLL